MVGKLVAMSIGSKLCHLFKLMIVTKNSKMRRDVFCQPNITGETCGFGTCDSTGTNCVCEPGYLHDTITPIFRNCFFPYALWLGYLVTIVVLAFLVFIFALYQRHYTASKARRLLELFMGISVFLGLYEIVIWFEGIQSWGSFTCYVILFTLIVEACCRLITVFTDSLSMFSGTTMGTMKQFLIFYRVISISTMIIFGVTALIYLHGFEDEAMFNFWFNFHYLALSANSACLAYVQYHSMQSLIDHVQQQKHTTNKRTEGFITKSKLLQKQMVSITISCVVLFLVTPCLHFYYKVFPYRFIVWIGTGFSLIGMCIACILFAKGSQQDKNVRSSVFVPSTPNTGSLNAGTRSSLIHFPTN